MIWLVSRFVVLPVKATAGGFKLGFRTGRLLGYRRLLLVAVGAVAGVLLAPGPGAELRDRLRARLQGGAARVPAGPEPFVAEPAVAAGVPWRPTRPAPPTAPAPPAPATTDPASAPATAAGSDKAPTAPAPPAPATDVARATTGDDGGEPLPAVPDADPVVEDPGR